jgi:hypothetical protein
MNYQLLLELQHKLIILLGPDSTGIPFYASNTQALRREAQGLV